MVGLVDEDQYGSMKSEYWNRFSGYEYSREKKKQG